MLIVGLLYDLAGFSIPFYVCGGILLISTCFALICFQHVDDIGGPLEKNQEGKIMV